MKHRKIAVIALSLVLAVFVAQATAEDITVGIPSQSITQVAFYAAKDSGYFAEEGLNVKLILMRAPIANIAVIAGQVNFTSVPNAGLVSIVRGAPMQIISASFIRPLFWMYARPEIKTTKDLKGKRIGFGGRASIAGTLAMKFLRENGMKLDRDVTFISTGRSPETFGALLSGSIDAGVMVIPWNFPG